MIDFDLPHLCDQELKFRVIWKRISVPARMVSYHSNFATLNVSLSCCIMSQINQAQTHYTYTVLGYLYNL